MLIFCVLVDLWSPIERRPFPLLRRAIEIRLRQESGKAKSSHMIGRQINIFWSDPNEEAGSSKQLLVSLDESLHISSITNLMM